MSRFFNGCDKSYDNSDIVLFGAPFDGTVSYRPGTRFAPGQMRIESFGLESYSPYLDLDLFNDASVYDGGDLELPFGNKEEALNKIEEYVSKIFKAGKKSFMIGGEHLVTLPAVKAALNAYPELCIIHFDAHTDLRDDYMEQELSHATVIKKIWNYTGDNRIFQFGIRSGLKEEFKWAQEGHVYIEKYSLKTVSETVRKLGKVPVYVTVDLDVLDPSVFPGTGTPEPGGVTFKELHEALISLKHLNIVGADVVELSPHYDTTGASTACACKVLRELLLVMTYYT